MAKKPRRQTLPSNPDPLPSIGALVDRARQCIPRAQLPHLVMNDPGVYDYVAAFEAVLAGGVPALLAEDRSGRPRMDGFDIHENLLLAHMDADRSSVHRWFSVLASCIELLSEGGPLDLPTRHSVWTLLRDGYALADAQDRDAPLDLLPAIFAELQGVIPSWDRPALAIAVVGELLTGTDDRAEALCRRLDEVDRELKDDQNPRTVEPTAFVWGGTLDHWPVAHVEGGLFGELRSWLDLVRQHFPTTPGVVAATRERLLDEGTQWLRP